ncbi:hypothetical protein ACW4FP_19350 (plasmid) [Paenarthrobacter ureafaciens]
MLAKIAKGRSTGRHGRGWRVALLALLIGLLIPRLRRPTQTESTDEADWTLTRSWLITAAIGFIGYVFALDAIRGAQPIIIDGQAIQVPQQAGSFVAIVSWAAFLAVSMASAWTVLLFGSSKNRTDTAAALLVFMALIIVNAVAMILFVDDRSQVDYCAGIPTGQASPDQLFPCDAPALVTAQSNADELQRITTLSSLGQVVPVLSISKDIFQSWFSPPGMDDSVRPLSIERKRARRQRRLSTERTKLAWAPVWVAGIIAAAFKVLSLIA